MNAATPLGARGRSVISLGRYCAQSVLLSNTGKFSGEESTIHSSDLGHEEDANGLAVDGKGAPARYVRHYAGSNNFNGGVHFINMEVYALDTGTSMTQSCKPY